MCPTGTYFDLTNCRHKPHHPWRAHYQNHWLLLVFITYLVQIKAFLYDQYDQYWPGPIWASTSSQANMGVSFLDVGSM